MSRILFFLLLAGGLWYALRGFRRGGRDAGPVENLPEKDLRENPKTGVFEPDEQKNDSDSYRDGT